MSLKTKRAVAIATVAEERDAALAEKKEALEILAVIYGPLPKSFTTLKENNERAKELLRRNGMLGGKDGQQ